MAALVPDVARLPIAVVLPALVALLSGLDIVGGLLAKSWSQRHSGAALIVGSGLFVLVFVVYGLALQLGRFSVVTVAWIVVVTVVDMIIDRFCFQADLPLSKWVAMLVAVAALAYVSIGSTA